MREILFRAKMKTDNGEYKKGDWVFGDLVRLRDGEKTLTMIYGFGEVDSSTIGQYTGLTDKHGTKIFEGDIVDFNIRGEDESYGVVKYSNENTEFYLSYDNSKLGLGRCNYSEELEVIGNVHDNPELLGVRE